MRIATVMVLLLPLAMPASEQKEATKRLDEAAAVFSEIMAAPDKGIPQDLLEKSHCIVIVPGLKKGAFIVGAKYGKGYLSCRKESGAERDGPPQAGFVSKEAALDFKLVDQRRILSCW